MVIYQQEFCAEQSKYLVHGCYNGTCASFSSTDDYAIGSTVIATDGIMVKFTDSTWTRYAG